MATSKESDAAPEGVTLHTPGDDAPPAANALESAAHDVAAQLAALQAENAGLKAMCEALQDKLDAASEGGAESAPPPAPRLIGENWSGMTAAECRSAGCTKTVLCRDGYYVPGR